MSMEPVARAKPAPDARATPAPDARAKPEPDARAKPAPSNDKVEGAITRAKAKKLAQDVHTMIMEELGGAARSFFNIFTKA
ncbi:unnamed protein product [Cochlearia groenlandica]